LLVLIGCISRQTASFRAEYRKSAAYTASAFSGYRVSEH
jgi:hypothetical protein